MLGIYFSYYKCPTVALPPTLECFFSIPHCLIPLVSSLSTRLYPSDSPERLNCWCCHFIVFLFLHQNFVWSRSCPFKSSLLSLLPHFQQLVTALFLTFAFFSHYASFTLQVNSQFTRPMLLLNDFIIPSDPFRCLLFLTFVFFLSISPLHFT